MAYITFYKWTFIKCYAGKQRNYSVLESAIRKIDQEKRLQSILSTKGNRQNFSEEGQECDTDLPIPWSIKLIIVRVIYTC